MKRSRRGFACGQRGTGRRGRQGAKSQAVAAYVSLIADAVTLQDEEKTQLQLPGLSFETLPALKIAKLAVSQSTYTLWHKY